ncbi:MAG: mannitol dehydrogenase family protein [Clostridia bacterium]|nr:mannitol dehydrogenase family protein [Clostridia bacterium]
MKLNLKALETKALWQEKGYALPEFDVTQITENTKKAPKWIHFGAGNIFRAFLGGVAQRLLNAGEMDTGIVVFEGFDPEIIEKAYRPFDNLSVGVTLISTGSVKKEVLGSVVESLTTQDDERTIEIFENPSLMMASFTITEKGYAPAFAQKDAEGRPEDARGLMGYLTKLMYKRYLKNAQPIALVSMDNCSHNGEKLEYVVKMVAAKWIENGYADAGFMTYLSEKVSFPWSMIDKITPRPDENVMKILGEDGFKDGGLIVTGKNTYTSAFVNAEEKEYLVIEDNFPNGRLPLDKAGVYYASRETVERVERMKVTTCLNPLHTSLAVFGCLLGFKTIWQEMNDNDLKALVNRIGYVEGMPVVTDPGIMKPETFLSEVLCDRLPNCFLPDTPQRIATDTSQKLSIRFGETIKEYLKRGMDVSVLKGIALTQAGWIRYLMGVDDNGNEMAISPDPRLSEMKERLTGIAFGVNDGVEEKLLPILEDETIFGVSLVKAGLADSVIANFKKMNAGAGEVRNAIHALVG